MSTRDECRSSIKRTKMLSISFKGMLKVSVLAVVEIHLNQVIVLSNQGRDVEHQGKKFVTDPLTLSG